MTTLTASLCSLIIIFVFFLFSLHSGSGICYPFIKTCVFGSEAKTGLLDDVSAAARSEGDSGSSLRQAIKLIFCAAGLQVGALTEHIVINRNIKKHAAKSL